MKKSIFILLVIIFIFIASCAPQVTVTSEVTVTSLPPTETLTPTPIFHPQFIALQEQIAASGERYTLSPDGLFDGAEKVQGITISPEGLISIDVNGEKVILDPSEVHFGSNGIELDGYELDDSGSWVSSGFDLDRWMGDDEERQEFGQIIKTIGYPVENISCDDKGVCKDPEGNTVWSKGEFDIKFVKSAIKEYGDAKSSPYGPSTGNVPPGTATDEVKSNVVRPLYLRAKEFLRVQNGGEPVLKQGPTRYSEFMISDGNNSWAVIITVDINNPDAPRYCVYEKEDDEMVVIPVKQEASFVV